MPDERRQPGATTAKSSSGVGFRRHRAPPIWTNHHYPQLAELIARRSRFGLIDDRQLLGLKLLKAKSICVDWENMFTRSVFQTAQHDLTRQGAKSVRPLPKFPVRSTLAI
jgi:hypothetical protein